MARKQTKSSPSLILVLFLALFVLGAWIYQQAIRARSIGPATAPASAQSRPESVRVATWNLRQFGSQATTDVPTVAKIIAMNRFDVMAIQEVQKDGRGVQSLLAALAGPWRSTVLSPESRSGERLGFIYRGDNVQELGQPEMLPGASPGVFERVPYCARFRAGNFDFELITVHLTWGNPVQRQQEVGELAKLLPRLAAGQAEKDIIILGDFNEQHTRPNLHLFTTSGWDTLVMQGTNLSSKEIYDHILINATYTREYSGDTGVYMFDEILFQNRDKEAVQSVSDHRPVWADFRTTMSDDD